MRLLVFVVIGFLVIASPAMAQDCTLAGTAVCNGVPCPGATRSEGHVLYNEDFQVLQTCRNGSWKALTPMAAAPPDPCAGSPSPGTTCADGSVYAGLSPDGNVPMYTTPADAPSLIAWNDGTTNWVDIPTLDNCTDNTPGTAATCQTGEANTALLVGLSGSGSPAPYQAAEYCDGLSVHGHSDWYLPAQDELDVLYDNKNAGDLNGTFNETGSFPAGWYWSSSEGTSLPARNQRFSVGTQGSSLKGNELAVRCVRR